VKTIVVVPFTGWCAISFSKPPLLHSSITQVILGAFYDTYNQLGPGFLESVYERALEIDLRQAGQTVERQRPVHVYFRSQIVGRFVADLIVNKTVIVELKCARTISRAHEAQVLNLLKATNLEIGLLLNFGTKPEFRRMVYSNELK
jgi:GxxExxY protein